MYLVDFISTPLIFGALEPLDHVGLAFETIEAAVLHGFKLFIERAKYEAPHVRKRAEIRAKSGRPFKPCGEDLLRACRDPFAFALDFPERVSA